MGKFFSGETKLSAPLLVTGLTVGIDFFVSIALNFFLPLLPYRHSGVPGNNAADFPHNCRYCCYL